MPKKPLWHKRPPTRDSSNLALQLVIGAIVVMAAIICGLLAAGMIYQ